MRFAAFQTAQKIGLPVFRLEIFIHAVERVFVKFHRRRLLPGINQLFDLRVGGDEKNRR